MLTAREKRNNNPAEYLIYMFQVEDMLRAFNGDLQQIEDHLVTPRNLPASVHKEMVDWYANLVLMMEKEKIREKGHLQFILNLINDLYDFHLRVMEYEADEEYIRTYRATAGLIAEVKRKSDNGMNEVETVLTALYGYMMLKISGKKVTTETSEAMHQFSRWLGMLSSLFRRFEKGDFEL
jgi:hypothetical protein